LPPLAEFLIARLCGKEAGMLCFVRIVGVAGRGRSLVLGALLGAGKRDERFFLV
jgi:hypothetical protein